QAEKAVDFADVVARMRQHSLQRLDVVESQRRWWIAATKRRCAGYPGCEITGRGRIDQCVVPLQVNAEVFVDQESGAKSPHWQKQRRRQIVRSERPTVRECYAVCGP